jgi:hypothetical protein
MTISVKYKCEKCECEYDDILIDEFKTEDEFIDWLEYDLHDTCINCGFDTAKIIEYDIRKELEDNEKHN